MPRFFRGGGWLSVWERVSALWYSASQQEGEMLKLSAPSPRSPSLPHHTHTITRPHLQPLSPPLPFPPTNTRLPTPTSTHFSLLLCQRRPCKLASTIYSRRAGPQSAWDRYQHWVVVADSVGVKRWIGGIYVIDLCRANNKC